jgi:hypothetical protein
MRRELGAKLVAHREATIAPVVSVANTYREMHFDFRCTAGASNPSEPARQTAEHVRRRPRLRLASGSIVLPASGGRES